MDELLLVRQMRAQAASKVSSGRRRGAFDVVEHVDAAHAQQVSQSWARSALWTGP